ncbi:MAG TPA: transglycosylase SLT domain-containing protein [Myxococcaceae bacterium]|nr:transglycosylase SLT domain-containing protein [Myxococcaceae bacterium]
MSSSTMAFAQPALTSGAEPPAAPLPVVDGEQSESQLDPSLDAEDEEGPPAFTEGPAARGAAGRSFRLEDVAPYFQGEGLAKAKAEFDRKRYRRARLLLGEAGDSPPVRYLKALSAFRARMYQEAFEEFRALAAEYLPLADDCLLHGGLSAAKVWRLNDALELWGKVSPESREYPQARLAMSDLLRRQGRVGAAMEALYPMVQPTAPAQRRDARAEAWLQLAKLARHKGDYNAEHRALLAVWSTYPFSREAAVAKVKLEGMPIPPRARVARAETLVNLHYNLEGMEALQPLLSRIDFPSEVGCRAHFAYGTALRKERKHSRAIRVLEPVVEKCQEPDLRPRALYVLGYSQSVVAPESAVPTYEVLARDYPNHAYADDALFFAAEMTLRNGDVAGGQKLLSQLVSRYPSGNYTAEALFKSYWVQRQGSSIDAGLTALSRIDALSGIGATYEQVQRARYWRARTLKAMGRQGEALALMQRVAEEGASTYYGLLARARLRADSPEQAAQVVRRAAAPMTPAQLWPLNAGLMAEDRHFRTGLELLRLGLPGAPQELLAVRRQGHKEEAIRLLFHLLQSGGHDAAASVVARAFLREGLGGPTAVETRMLWEAAFPHKFRRLVEKHSKAASVDPDLMQALIREESAFNPRARSATGALGLSQLMPQTAFQVARRLRASGVTRESLLLPYQNIRIGSAYLGNLTKMFEGNAAYAVASYNAGPLAVNRWLRRFPTAELDEWVEEIPVEETRNYVKRVLGSYSTYALLYEEGDADALAFGARP